MKKDIQISVRITSELRDRLRDLATTEHRTLASYVTLVLQAHVDQASASQRRARR